MKINKKILIIILIAILILVTLYYTSSNNPEKENQTQNVSNASQDSTPVRIHGSPVVGEEKISIGG